MHHDVTVECNDVRTEQATASDLTGKRSLQDWFKQRPGNSMAKLAKEMGVHRAAQQDHHYKLYVRGSSRN